DGGGERGGRHHVHGAREPRLGQHLPRRRQDQDQPRRRLPHEVGQGLQRPVLDRARLRTHAPPPDSAARSSSRRTSPIFTSGSATATTRRPDASPPGTTSSAPCSAWRCQKTLAPVPAASIARRRRPARLAASAATAPPLIPSMSCSATTSPSSAETSIAPRTPRTRVIRSSALFIAALT